MVMPLQPRGKCAADEESVKSTINFTINGKNYSVGPEVPPWTLLVDFLREKARLSGTKVLCREGGCGICIVVVTRPDHETPGAIKTHSINSCLLPVYSCDGWQIETVESLGDRFDGYHPIQTAIHGFAGTQCGYCTPGMVMSMYGQLKNGTLIMSQVQKSLDGNLCRCTGYRPILDAFKSLATDATNDLKERLMDIEEAYKGSCKKSNGKGCGGCSNGGHCGKDENNCSLQTLSSQVELKITSGGIHWYRPTTIEGIYSALRSLGYLDKVKLVVGNTSAEDGPYSAYICTNDVPELYRVSTESSMVLGANVSFTRAIEVFKSKAASDPSYEHLGQIAKHWQYVANTSVRNVGCWAGNMMMKHLHQHFQSDVFLTLLSVDAKLTIGNAADSKTAMMDMEQFLKTNMFGKVILSVTLPPFPSDTKLRTFKITPQAVTAPAYVNAAFRMQLDTSDGHRVIGRPLIALGGISQHFVRASLTEEFLTNKKIGDEDTVRQAVKLLGKEVIPDACNQDASPEYRRSLSQTLLFKAIVGFLGNQISCSIQSAGDVIERPISSGQQYYDVDENIWPVGKPVPKLESATQISGEARYMDDMPSFPDELHAAFVLTTVANAKIKSISVAEALKQPGVVTWVSKDDIPGQNSFIVLGSRNSPKLKGPDPVFVAERVKYAGQPVGIIVAENRDIAVRAAKLVTVEYEDIQKPVLSIKESISAGRCHDFLTGLKLGDFDETIQQVPYKLNGELSIGGQFHMSMEPLSARVIPTEDGYDIFCTTQWPTETQITAAAVLNVPNNNINVSVRRIGGGFGSKLTRQHIVSTAAAVAARKLKRPVRLVTDLTSNMSFAGWRHPCYMKYEVGFTPEGKLMALKVDNTSDCGHVVNEPDIMIGVGVILNAYSIPNLTCNLYEATTDTAANTYCRCPGLSGTSAAIENIIEHVAHYLRKDPFEIRELNLAPPQTPRLFAPPVQDNAVKELLHLFKDKANFWERKKEVDEFNKANRWKKRGISMVPMLYAFDYMQYFRFSVQVTIYAIDGTVAVSHGGIEMGQGLNTKVAQVTAHTLRVPLDKIVFKATDTMMGSNSFCTAASTGSDLCCHGLIIASSVLRKRLDVVEASMKEETGKDPTWTELIQKAHSMDVDLSERYWTAEKEHPERYDIVGATCLEVELDVLTGVYRIRRADIIEDCGRSLSPYIDIGQIEGAFIMGIGLHTSEELKFNPETGQKLSNSTRTYNPPTAHDIPVDLRITLLPNHMSGKAGVLGSKASGEPPLCMSYATITALRQAISSFRSDNGNTEWFEMNSPVTVEKAQQLCGVHAEQFKLYTDDTTKL